MTGDQFAVFVTAVFFAWIRVVIGPTHQPRDILANFCIGFFVCFSLTLVNLLIYSLIIKYMDSILERRNRR
jgi:multisubunit Na+/H+ antiporter MnhF subunit